jgi:ParB family transcriptional regulator, chromosome partitioning protein
LKIPARNISRRSYLLPTTIMQFDSKTVSIDSIYLKNDYFRISTPKPIDDLIVSIDQFGLLSPPIIKAFNNGYIIVSGFHRVYACKKLGWIDIETRGIGSEIQDKDCMTIAIADNSFHRKMNLMEQSIALSKLANFFGSENEFIKIAKTLGFGDNSEYIKKLMTLQTLIPELQQSILTGAISMSIAIEIGRIDKESMLKTIHLFEELRPTLNQQKEILSLVWENSKIKNVPVKEILCGSNINEIINNPDIARAQKIKNLRTCLHKMRFPAITGYYDQFNELVHRLSLPNKIKLAPPENFEDVCYSMILKFESVKEFESHIEALTKLLRIPEFNFIFSQDFANL